MKENNKMQINAEDVARFKTSCTIFVVLAIALTLSAVLFSVVGGGSIWSSAHIVLLAATIYFAIRVEKGKRRFDFKTYKELLAFYKGKTLEDIVKNRENGKND